MNIKLERINHAIQEEISVIISREVKDEELHTVVVTGVDTSSDLSYAKVYYTVFEKDKLSLIDEKLKKASPYIRKELASRIEVRHTPELNFIYDTSIEYGEHIDEIIENIKTK